MRTLSDHGYVADGHDTPRAELLAQARTALIEGGMHPLDVDNALVDRPGLIVRAWMADHPDGGEHFVQEHHTGARPVIVVHAHPEG